MSDDTKVYEFKDVYTPVGVVLLSAIEREDQKYGGYKIWLGFTEDEQEVFRAECVEFFKQHPKTSDKKRLRMPFLPSDKWQSDDEYAGLYLLKSSKTAFAPAVFDAAGEPIFHPGDADGEGKVGSQRDVPRIARGTTARAMLRLSAVEERNDDGQPNGNWKPIARLKAVQIVDLVEWKPTGGGARFGAVKGSFVRGGAGADDEEEQGPDAGVSMPAVAGAGKPTAAPNDPTSF